MNNDNNFKSRMNKWETEIFRTKWQQEIFKFVASQKASQNRNKSDGHDPNTDNRRTRHDFDSGSNFDFFSMDRLGLLDEIVEAGVCV